MEHLVQLLAHEEPSVQQSAHTALVHIAEACRARERGQGKPCEVKKCLLHSILRQKVFS